jgi:hypothetical protein
MPTIRERVLQGLRDRLAGTLTATVRRNEALPERIPGEGLVILRDGNPGEPDVTLNPLTAFYSHRIELELFVAQPTNGGGETLLDALVTEVHAALAPDPSLGGLAENLVVTAPETGVLAVEGAAPILIARLNVLVEYLVSDPLAG